MLADRGQSFAAEAGEDAVAERLPVGAHRRGLVGVPGARPDDAGLGCREPVVGRLVERDRGGRAQGAFAERDLAFLPPRACLGERRERLADRLAVAGRPDLRLIARRAGTGPAISRGAAARMAYLDAFMRPPPWALARHVHRGSASATSLALSAAEKQVGQAAVRDRRATVSPGLRGCSTRAASGRPMLPVGYRAEAPNPAQQSGNRPD